MRYRIVVASAAVLPLTALAYTHGKPGLWEITSQTSFTKGGPQVAQPQIPPDKLAMMKQMGIQLPATTPGGSHSFTTKVCVTPEEANTDSPPPPDRQRACQMQNLKRDGHTFTADMVCSGEMQGSGHMSVTYDSDEHYSGKMEFSGTSEHLGEVATSNEFSGRWLGADCGTVKPFVRPKTAP